MTAEERRKKATPPAPHPLLGRRPAPPSPPSSRTSPLALSALPQQPWRFEKLIAAVGTWFTLTKTRKTRLLFQPASSSTSSSNCLLWGRLPGAPTCQGCFDVNTTSKDGKLTYSTEYRELALPCPRPTDREPPCHTRSRALTWEEWESSAVVGSTATRAIGRVTWLGLPPPQAGPPTPDPHRPNLACGCLFLGLILPVRGLFTPTLWNILRGTPIPERTLPSDILSLGS